jgi:hypothetical protein
VINAAVPSPNRILSGEHLPSVNTPIKHVKDGAPDRTATPMQNDNGTMRNWEKLQNRDSLQRMPFQVAFVIRHSSFVIRHSSFVIPSRTAAIVPSPPLPAYHPQRATP